jgi:hypothetical protein
VAFLLGLFWPWLVLVLACSALVGWMTAGTANGRPGSRAWLVMVVLAFVVGLVVAFMQWLPGRAGLWLETGLMFVASFALGCGLGALLRPQRREGKAD